MREVNCYNCGSEARKPYTSENGFALVQCMSCGLLYVNPRPAEEDIEAAHKLGVHHGEDTLNMTGQFNQAKLPRYLAILEDFFGNDVADGQDAPRKWLDIGCGHGEFVMALQKFGGNNIEARGLEPNVLKQESARAKKLDVSYFDLLQHSERYDAISLLNVYSHLPDPPVAIAGWTRLLRPGGEMFLETGDTAGLPPSQHPRPLLLPDHLSFASEKIVVRILEDCGFEIVSIKKYPFADQFRLSMMKELLKGFWPGKTSKFRYMIRPNKYRIDMYIRARLRQ